MKQVKSGYLGRSCEEYLCDSGQKQLLREMTKGPCSSAHRDSGNRRVTGEKLQRTLGQGLGGNL